VRASYSTNTNPNPGGTGGCGGVNLTAAAFTDTAGSQAGAVSPGALVDINVPGLAAGIQGCLAPDAPVGAYPMEIGTISVLFGGASGLPSPMVRLCNQGGREYATVQVPFEVAAGSTPVVLRKGSCGYNASLNVAAAAPGLFRGAGASHAIAVRPDGSYVSPDNPAKRGEFVRVFAGGMGPFLSGTGTNRPGANGADTNVRYPVTVGLNNAGVTPTYARYAANLTGVWEIAFEIPADAATGASVPLSIGVETPSGMAYSNAATLAIQ